MIQLGLKIFSFGQCCVNWIHALFDHTKLNALHTIVYISYVTNERNFCCYLVKKFLNLNKIFLFIQTNFSFEAMTNEATVVYKSLRRVFCEKKPLKKEDSSTFEKNALHIIELNCDEPAKLSKSPRLRVCTFKKKNCYILVYFQSYSVPIILFIFRNGFLLIQKKIQANYTVKIQLSTIL